TFAWVQKAMESCARWNAGVFVKLAMSDEAFLAELLRGLKVELEKVHSVKTVIAAIHHLPFRELLPPSHSAQWDFAKAYLGASSIGQLLLSYKNVQVVVCGHSHFGGEARVGERGVRAVNVGAGYRVKKFLLLEV